MATQILQIIPRPVSPVAPVQAVAFANDYMLLARMPVKFQKVIRILGLITSLNKVRAVDYRTNPQQLIADAAAYTNGISNLSIGTSLAAIEWSDGNTADPTLTSDIEGLLKRGAVYLNYAELELDRMIVLLEASVAQ